MQRSGSQGVVAKGGVDPHQRTRSEDMLRYAPPEKTKPLHPARSRSQAILYALALALLPASLLYIYSRGLTGALSGGDSGVQYEVVIDAGSSGSRVHVFRYTFSPGSALPELLFPDDALKVKPGLSSFASHPRDAGESLTPLLEFAAAKVPSWARSRTPLTLYATAGLRLLRPATAGAILESCRGALLGGPFRFQREWASVLSGTNEGLYGWVAANYGAGRLAEMARSARGRQKQQQPARQRGLAVAEMGGASAQVTFVLDDASSGDSGAPATTLQVGRAMGPLPMFTHSFLGAGQEAAQVRAQELVATGAWQEAWRAQRGDGDPSQGIFVTLDPCYPPGVVHDDGGLGVGNFTACRAVAADLLAHEGCAPSAAHSCIAGTPVPRWEGAMLAIENFHYTAEMLGLGQAPTLEEIAAAGEAYCATSWPQLQQRYSSRKSEVELLKYCFSAAYIVTFLAEGLGVAGDERRLRFANEVAPPSGAAVDVDWAMGHVVVAAAQRGPGSVVGQPRLRARLELMAAATVALVALAVVWKQTRGRRLLVVSLCRGTGSGRGSRAYYDVERGGYRYLA